MLSSLLAATASILLLAGLGPIPIPIPIVPPSEPPEAPPPPDNPPPPPGPSPDPDGFPDVGKAYFVDTGNGSVNERWGSTDCVNRDRIASVKRGGDAGPRADGKLEGTHRFRRLRVLDGDDFYGERCEIGLNDHRRGPTALYREGDRLITYISLKLSKKFPLERDLWQVVMQMKQTQPSDNGGGTPILALLAQDGRWRLIDQRSELWSAPARANRWTRFSFDVTYSDAPTEGAIRVAADLNADGDAHDTDERSRKIKIATLKTEGTGTDDDGIVQGTAIPSHLRAGVYHEPSYRCSRYKCSIGVDNVGVYEPD